VAVLLSRRRWAGGRLAERKRDALSCATVGLCLGMRLWGAVAARTGGF